MTLARTRGIAALAVVLLGGAAVSGQANKFPGPDQQGIAETKTMHADIIRAIEANTRAQIVIARLASADARVSGAAAQVADAQREAAEATRARAAAETEIRRLTQGLLGQQEGTTATNQLITQRRQEMGALQHEEQTSKAQLARAQQALAAEQARRTELSGRLDELEKSLVVR